MLTANVEATQRLPLPAASHRDQAAGDVFADLLRQLGDSAEPAPSRPEKPERPQARKADEPQPERIADEDEAAQAIPVANETADTERAETAGEDHDPGEAEDRATAADPADDAAAPPAETAAPDVPAADDASQATGPIQVAGTATTPAAAATAPTAMETIAAPIPGAGAGPVARTDAAPAQPATAAPAPAPAPAIAAAAAAAAVPAPAAGTAPAGTTETTTPAAIPGTAAAAAPASPVPAGTQPIVATVTPASAAGDPATPTPAAPNATDTIAAADTAAATGDSDGNIVVRADRSPAPAPGLAKLGTGAEVALAAQAAGDRPQGMPADQAGKTNPATPPAQAAAARPGQSGNPAALQAAAPAAATGTRGATTAAAPATASLAQPELAPATAATAADETLDGIGSVSALGLRSAGGAHAAQTAAAPRAAGIPSPAEQVAVQIQRAVGDGASRITVQLKPAELGSIEIQLDFTQDGRVSASILADRRDTLDLLQRDARLLERSLQDAGLKADSGSLSFDLRDGGRNGAGSQQTAGGNRHEDPVPNRNDNQASTETTPARPAPTSASDRGVDIRV